MNTLQFYKDAVAVKYGSENWLEFVRFEAFKGFFNPQINQHFLDAENEAATLYAEEACKEQRILCSKALHFTLREPVREYIENAPLAVNTEKV